MSELPRIGVITFYRYNYGGFLQAYALQRALISLGCDAELIRYDYLRDPARFGTRRAWRASPLGCARRVAGSAGYLLRGHALYRTLGAAARRLLRESGRFRSARRLCAARLPYDVCISGSDQVLNPQIHPVGLALRLQEFSFAPPPVRATYAASLGLDVCPGDEAGRMARALKRFSALSVRERQTARALAELGFPALPVHPDPVFLLEADAWRVFARRPPGLFEPFIFVHALAGQAEMTDYVDRLSERMGLRVLSSDARRLYRRQLRRARPLRPEEFVWCALNARCVVTNSFHGTALTVQLERPVRVFLPAVAPERIGELLVDCGLERCLCGEPPAEAELNALYASKRAVMARRRAEALDYLRGIAGLTG